MRQKATTRKIARRPIVGHLLAVTLASLMDVGLADEEPHNSSRPLDDSREDAAVEFLVSEQFIKLQEAIQIVKNKKSEVPTCELNERKIVLMEVLDVTQKAGQSSWIEKWIVDRCGQLIHYTYQVTRTLKEGQPNYDITIVDDDR